jgi:hypothetical protein
MNRLIKKLLAFCYFLTGCLLIMCVEAMLSEVSWLNPIFIVLCFALILVGGLYVFFKIVRRLVYLLTVMVGDEW